MTEFKNVPALLKKIEELEACDNIQNVRRAKYDHYNGLWHVALILLEPMCEIYPKLQEPLTIYQKWSNTLEAIETSEESHIIVTCLESILSIMSTKFRDVGINNSPSEIFEEIHRHIIDYHYTQMET